MKKRLIFYPCDKESTSIARYNDLLKDYEMTGAVAYKGSASEGEDISYLDGGEQSGVTISESYSTKLDECDTVLFLKGRDTETFEEYSEKIALAIQKEKEIIVEESIYYKLNLEKIPGDKSKIKVLKENDIDYKEISAGNYRKRIVSINKPIILVFGAGEHCNKFEIQLGLRRHFINNNFKVSQLGTKKFSDLFGFKSIPKFMYQTDISVEDKIIAFNHYVHRLELEENPDVFIIGIPGGIMRLNDIYTNRFGEMAFLIGNAVEADIGIMSTYYMSGLNNEFLKDIKTKCDSITNCSTNYFNISNWTFNMTSFDGELKYFNVNNNKVNDLIMREKECCKENDILLTNILQKQCELKLYNNIVSELSENLELI